MEEDSDVGILYLENGTIRSLPGFKVSSKISLQFHLMIYLDIKEITYTKGRPYVGARGQSPLLGFDFFLLYIGYFLRKKNIGTYMKKFIFDRT